MAFPSWGGAVGGALTGAATAYLKALNDEPDERLARRKAELDVQSAEEKLESNRQLAAAGGKPIVFPWGGYTINPSTKRYTLELPRPDQPRKPFAKEAELELMLDWSTSDDPYKQDIARSYLDKQQAPGRQVDIRSRTADAQITHLQRQQDYWQSRADEARRHNSAMEGIYRRKAEQVSGELGSYVQAQQWLDSGTPEQQAAAQRYLEGKDAVLQREQRQQDLQPGKVEKQALDIATAEEKLNQLKTRSEFLEPKLQQDLDLQIERVKQLKARGERLGPYLDAQIRKLEEQIVASQERRNRPGGGGGASQVDVQPDPRGPTTRYRGADVRTYNEAVREGIETLTPLNEADATAAVSRQPIGPRRDGYIQAWRSKFPGRVFRPTQGVVPSPEPRRPTSGRRGERDRESAITAPDTRLDQLAKERYGRKYVELDPEQQVDLEEEAGQITMPPKTEGTTPAPAAPAQTPPAPAAPAPKPRAQTAPAPRAAAPAPSRATPLPKPGTPEHRAYTTYKKELPNVPQDTALEAWEAVRTSGTTAEKQAFKRAYQEQFKEELR